MSKYSSKDASLLLVDGFDIRGVSTALSDAKEAVLRETTALGDTWPAQQDTGLRKAEFATDGFYDTATGSINEALADKEGVSRVVCHGVEGNAVGRNFRGHAGVFAGKYVRTAQLNEFHRAKGEYVVSGQVDDGKILQPLATVTTDGDTESTPVDHGASSFNGGAAYAQVSALTLGAATNLVQKVRHSVDDLVYADLVTFTAATARTAERKTASGTVNRYLAASRAWTGGSSGASATVFVGFARG